MCGRGERETDFDAAASSCQPHVSAICPQVCTVVRARAHAVLFQIVRLSGLRCWLGRLWRNDQLTVTTVAMRVIRDNADAAICYAKKGGVRGRGPKLKLFSWDISLPSIRTMKPFFIATKSESGGQWCVAPGGPPTTKKQWMAHCSCCNDRSYMHCTSL